MSRWVLLRGLTREARHWGDFPAVFRTVVADATTVTPDLPGNGLKNHLTSPLNVGDMVESCRADLRQYGFSPPFHLLGLSMGAMVAVEWAGRYPHELLSCVLINTSLRPFSPFYQRLRTENYVRLLVLAILRRNAAAIEREVFNMTSTRRPAPTAVIDSWVSYRERNPVTFRNQCRQLIASARFRAPNKPPAVPLLILAGLKDTLVDPQCSRHLSDKWLSRLFIHTDAGHDLPLDDGVWVAEQVRDWLATFVGLASLPQDG